MTNLEQIESQESFDAQLVQQEEQIDKETNNSTTANAMSKELSNEDLWKKMELIDLPTKEQIANAKEAVQQMCKANWLSPDALLGDNADSLAVFLIRFGKKYWFEIDGTSGKMTLKGDFDTLTKIVDKTIASDNPKVKEAQNDLAKSDDIVFAKSTYDVLSKLNSWDKDMLKNIATNPKFLSVIPKAFPYFSQAELKIIQENLNNQLKDLKADKKDKDSDSDDISVAKEWIKAIDGLLKNINKYIKK